MDFPKLDQASADPRPRWKCIAEQTVAIRLRHVPAAAAADILRLRLRTLDARLAEIYETWGSTEADAQAALDEFDDGLMADARAYHARQRELADDGVGALADSFTRTRHHALEIEGLKVTLRPRERALVVGWLSIKTSERSIPRAEYRDAARPTTWSNESTWTRQFIPIDQLANLEQEEVKAAERAVAPLNYGRNLDYGAAGVRPGAAR